MQPAYTPSQYQRILKILNEENKAEEVVNMAGIFNDSDSVTVCLCNSNHDEVMSANDTPNKEETWIVDSGAIFYMTSRVDMLDEVSNSNKSVGRKVYLPNGQTTYVTHSGNCSIPSSGVLENVLVVPDFKYNLLSVSQLTRQLRCSVRFFSEFCIFQDLFNGEVRGIGNEVEGLYCFPKEFSYITKKADSMKMM